MKYISHQFNDVAYDYGEEERSIFHMLVLHENGEVDMLMEKVA